MKSFVGIKAITTVKNKNPKILFLAETRAREQTLHEEIAKYNSIFGTNIKVPQFMCYQSAYKLSGEHYDLVIADEIHDSITEKYSLFYKNNTWDSLIGLTATPRVDKELSLVFYTKLPIVFGATVEDAVESGDILDYKLKIIDHTLDSKNKYIEAGKKGSKFKTTEKSNYQFLSKIIGKSFYTGNEVVTRLFAARRAKLLYELESKKPLVKKLLKKHKDDKIIIFGNSIPFLESICKNVVKGSDKNSLSYIDDFNKGKINVIGSFKMLQQGVNLKGANVVIIASYYSIAGKFIQRIGRVLRKDSDTPIVYIIQTKNTIEERWVKKMLDQKQD